MHKTMKVIMLWRVAHGQNDYYPIQAFHANRETIRAIILQVEQEGPMRFTHRLLTHGHSSRHANHHAQNRKNAHACFGWGKLS